MTSKKEVDDIKEAISGEKKEDLGEEHKITDLPGVGPAVAAKIEGATSYEMFWLITLPNVSPHIVTVTVYALVDTFLTSPVSGIISDELKRQAWGLSSAMAWIYVGTIIVMLGSLAVLAKGLKIGGSHYEN